MQKSQIAIDLVSPSRIAVMAHGRMGMVLGGISTNRHAKRRQKQAQDHKRRQQNSAVGAPASYNLSIFGQSTLRDTYWTP